MNKVAIELNNLLRETFYTELKHDPISDWYSALLGKFEVVYLPPDEINDSHYIMIVPNDCGYPIYEVILPNEKSETLNRLIVDIAKIDNYFDKIMEDFLSDTGFYDKINLLLQDYMV